MSAKTKVVILLSIILIMITAIIVHFAHAKKDQINFSRQVTPEATTELKK